MNLIYLALLCGMMATSFVYKSEARLQAESIVGGNVAAENQYAYSVSIQINDQHYFGGGILNNRYILTVAHPFIDPNNRFINSEYTVVAGATYAHKKEEPHRVKREVAKIYIPRAFFTIELPNFPRRKTADIAVLELTSDLGLNPFITHVVLPPNAMPHPTYENQPSVVSGYGHTWVTVRQNPRTNRRTEVFSGSYFYQRRFAQVKILSNRACQNLLTDIKDSHLCGHLVQRSPLNPEGLCTGDSGSPLVTGETIIGVVSYSPTGCREDLRPAVYTRVTPFIPFITNAMSGVRAANTRVAKYEVISCGRGCNKKVLVEQ